MRVVITSRMPAIAEEILRKAGHEALVRELNRPDASITLAEALEDADGAITVLTDRVTGEVFEGCPRLQIVANCAVGTNNIDLSAARQHNVCVTNTPDVLTDATADLTMGLILAVTRRMLEGDEMVRSGQFGGWHPLMLLGRTLKGMQLGIVGLGRIGSAVATRARAFGMEISHYSRSAHSSTDPSFKRLELGELLRTSDVLSLHTPLTDETRRLIDERALSVMRPGSYLINTARGEVVHEEALAAALESGHLAGAGLDVFEQEPSVTPALLNMRNTVLLPHVGSATVEARTEMARIAATNVALVLGGSTPSNPVR